MSGLAATVFLYLLDLATRFRLAHPSLLWALPLAGFAVGWLYHRHGQDVAGGNNLILQEIHDPKKVVPLRMAPLILVGTLITHLFGGSAGREGTAVQMSASLADQLAIPFGLSPQERRRLLVAGVGSGFGAAVGAPWAGVVFGMEVIQIGRRRPFALWESIVASFVAFGVARLLQAPHSLFPRVTVPPLSGTLFGSLLVAGLVFGLAAATFSRFTQGLEGLQKRFVAYPPLKPLIGGVLLVALFCFEGSHRYEGLGLEVIQEALRGGASAGDALKKAGFTGLTLASGFKGGEFVPLVFVGSTLGSALGQLLGVSPAFLAALGFGAVFAGASKTPLACSLMLAELFGWSFFPTALVTCYASFYVSGSRGIYSAQKPRGARLF